MSNVRIVKDGVTGFVVLKDNIAVKHSLINELYWCNELYLFHFLKHFKLDNIVQMDKVEIGNCCPEYYEYDSDACADCSDEDEDDDDDEDEDADDDDDDEDEDEDEDADDADADDTVIKKDISKKRDIKKRNNKKRIKQQDKQKTPELPKIEKKSDNKLYVKLYFKRYSEVKAHLLYRPVDIIQFLLDITSGLNFLHSNGIIHRDFKIKNILSDNGRYIIIDFSHSYKITKYNNKFRDIVTTPSHEAPEITIPRLDKKIKPAFTYTTAVDMWALGIILLDMISKGTATRDINNNNDTSKYLYKICSSQSSVYKFIDARLENVKPVNPTFLKWVRLLLTINPAKRITASALYRLVKIYAENNNITHRIPSNGSTSPNVREYFTPHLISRNLELFIKITNMVRDYGSRIYSKKFNDLPLVIVKAPNGANSSYLKSLTLAITILIFDEPEELEETCDKIIPEQLFDIIHYHSTELLATSINTRIYSLAEVPTETDTICKCDVLPIDEVFKNELIKFLEL
jgi:serine/threonine protein kinase